MKLSDWNRIKDRLIVDAEKSVKRRNSERKTDKNAIVETSVDETKRTRASQLTALTVIALAVVFLTYGAYRLFYEKPNSFIQTTQVPLKKIAIPENQPNQTVAQRQTAPLEDNSEKINTESQQENPSPPVVEDLLQKGIALYNARQFKTAATVFKHAMLRGDTKARLLLARSLRALNASECLKYYLEELDAAKSDEALVYEAGTAMIQFGADKLALEYAKKYLSINPKSYKILLLAADSNESQKDWNAAIPYLKEALAVAADPTEVLWKLGAIFLAVGDLGGALREYQRLLVTLADKNQKIIVAQKIAEIKKQIEDSEKPEEPAQEADDSSATYVKLNKIGDHFTVPVKLNSVYETELAIDTGASITAISPSIAEQIGLSAVEANEYIELQTAGGVIKAPVFIIDKIQIGDYVIESFRIAVLYPIQQSQLQGILGMDFLKFFNFSINADEQVLVIQMNPD
jgi:clan AA aspartic protease (TIGR02281 family)